MKKLFGVATFLFLSACGTGRLTVVEPIKKEDVDGKVTINFTQHTVDPTPEVLEDFKTLLQEKLNEKGIEEGGNLLLECSFVQIDEGSRFQRWFFGGIGNAGEGSATIKVVYRNKSGAPIGEIRAEGRIGSGFYGGGFSGALEKAAEQIANYTAKAIPEKPAKI